MYDVVIVDAVRTSSGRGKATGNLAELHPVDLLASTLEHLLERNPFDTQQIDDVVAGCVTQAGEQASNIARHAVLAAGLPETVPAMTVDRQCGSSQQAMHIGAQAIASGNADVVVACGVESMSRKPMLSNVGSSDSYGSRLAARYEGGLIPQGISAELVAARYGLDRIDLDTYAARSHHRATSAWSRAVKHVVPLADIPLTGDETTRPESTVEALGELRPAFVDEQMAERFPEIGWSVTAGNSSPITDGASATLLMSAD